MDRFRCRFSTKFASSSCVLPERKKKPFEIAFVHFHFNGRITHLARTSEKTRVHISKLYKKKAAAIDNE